MTIEDQMVSRAAADYADFLMPHLGKGMHLLDVGCGDGALTRGLASVCRHVTGLNLSSEELRTAAATSPGLHDLSFVRGDATRLPFSDQSFDAVLAHSVLESGVEPGRVLAEAWRVLRPGGWLAVASVEYGGLILAGPQVELLRRSNDIRELMWLRSGADPFLGRHLRRLALEAMFVNIEATTKAFSYGTPDRVRAFAQGRAAECSEAEYVTEAVGADLTTEYEMAEMAAAWSRWGESQTAYAAFTWCRALARRGPVPC